MKRTLTLMLQLIIFQLYSQTIDVQISIFQNNNKIVNYKMYTFSEDSIPIKLNIFNDTVNIPYLNINENKSFLVVIDKDKFIFNTPIQDINYISIKYKKSIFDFLRKRKYRISLGQDYDIIAKKE